VAHTIFWEAGPEARANMGIGDSMIRLSVGLEELQDLLADFEQATGRNHRVNCWFCYVNNSCWRFIHKRRRPIWFKYQPKNR